MTRSGRESCTSDSLGLGPHPAALFNMFMLYLDDAGSVGAKDQTHFILSGLCVFERQIHYLTTHLDNLAKRFSPEEPEKIEFHGSHILPGKGFWRSIRPREKRHSLIREALAAHQILRGSWALFGIVVNKREISPRDPIEFAFEQICTRFDAFLRRQYLSGNKQRGLIILDKSARETRLQTLATEFKTTGHSYGILRNIADVPMFVDSSATRTIQYADLVSYALWQKFEKGDGTFFDVIGNAFDSEGGVVHGLLHKKDAGTLCDCPYCATRW